MALKLVVDVPTAISQSVREKSFRTRWKGGRG